MKNRKSLLFWGELPPNVFHGISLSNERILSALSVDFDIHKVEDNAGFRGRLMALCSFLISLLKLIRLSSRKVDIYYLNAPMSYLGLWKVYLSILTVKAFSSRVKVISHLHRGDFLEFIKNKRNKRLFKRFTSQLDTLLVLSKRATLELAESFLIDENKVEVLHNTVAVVAQKENILIAADSAFNERYFYCLCNYIPSKRIHKLVEIVNQINLVNVNFNGTSSGDNYMERINKLDTHSICRFDGVINGVNKETKLRSAKALILPSLNEGMPLVILESLAQGTPVICFDIGYISDYIGKDYPGLVTELTDQALKDKIIWLNKLSNDDYLSLRKRSFKLFWKSFDPEIINSTTSVIFKKV
ncbi:glycosyltransferase [Shewanella frigidimarina]|uniref:glycosyltransferase family 4 protein n=1 Tax=Shewanella frigidimarina TaxID=56812 RepID=UPI00316C3B7E